MIKRVDWCQVLSICQSLCIRVLLLSRWGVRDDEIPSREGDQLLLSRNCCTSHKQGHIYNVIHTIVVVTENEKNMIPAYSINMDK